MPDYVANINQYTIGGDTFNSGWVDINYVVFDSVTFTAGQTSDPYSLSSVLPDDGYIYECQFSAYVRTGGSSGNYASGYLSSGSLFRYSYWCSALAGLVTRTSSNRAGAGNCILPIFPNDRNVVWKNVDGAGTSGACGLTLVRARRIGTNQNTLVYCKGTYICDDSADELHGLKYQDYIKAQELQYSIGKNTINGFHYVSGTLTDRTYNLFVYATDTVKTTAIASWSSNSDFVAGDYSLLTSLQSPDVIDFYYRQANISFNLSGSVNPYNDVIGSPHYEEKET